MKKLALPIAVVAALMFVGLSADSAEAKGFRISFGGHGVHASYGGGHCGYSPSYHDTSYTEWHPPRIRPHGNHYHVEPGHWHTYNRGHWHW